MASMKDSGIEWIGDIPEDWSVCRLAKTGAYINGNAFKPEDWADEGLPIIRIQDLSGSNDSPNYFKGQAHPKYLIHNGDVLVSWAATLAAYRWTGGDAWLNQHIFKVVPSKSMDTTYLFYLLAASMEHLDSGDKHGIMMQHLTLRMFNHCLVPLPSYVQQRAIGRALERDCSQIDATSNTLEAQISTLERYRASVIHEAVTRGLDPTAPTKPSNVDWIGEIPQGWDIKPFKRVASVVANLVEPSNYPDLIEIDPENIESGTGRLTDIRTVEEVGAISAKQLFSKGQIIYSKIRPALNKVVIAPEDGLCSADMYPIATQHNVRWLLYVMRSDIFVNQTSLISSRVAMPKINVDQLGALKIPVPLIDEQAVIADYLDTRTAAIDAVIATKRKQLDVLKQRRQSLIYEYVTGKRRVGEEG